MKAWFHKIEVIVDKLIPLLLAILLLIIVIEFGFHEFAEKYHTIIEILDWIIVSGFILDLIFKYNRIRNIPKFLRAAWIDILAVFPFFLVFRVLEGFLVFEASETLTKGQKIVHVGVELEKEVKVVKEVGRAEHFSKFLRPIARSFRFFKLGNPEVREKVEKDAEEIAKEAEKGEKVVIKGFKKGVKVVGKQVYKGTKIVEEQVKFGEEFVEKKVPRYVKNSLFFEAPEVMKKIKIKHL